MTGEPESFVLLPEGRRLMVLAQNDGACSFLVHDRCSVYAQRPSACRIYPFDVTLGKKGGVRRLKLLQPGLCTGDTRGRTKAGHLSRQYQTHQSELRAHVLAVQAFNRRQARRQRVGLPLLSAEHFIGTALSAQHLSAQHPPAQHLSKGHLFDRSAQREHPFDG